MDQATREELVIDPEFRSLIPTTSIDELSGLEKSLLDEGCRDPLVTWDGVLLDGHNRYEICRRHEIPFRVIGKTFDNRDQAKLWIICNQLSRRNITPEQRTYLIGIQAQLEKKQQGRDPQGHFEPTGKPLEKIADEHHVSPATVKRAEKFARAVDKLPPKEKEDVLSGKTRKTKQDIISQNEKPKSRLTKLGPPSNGLQFARMAIMDLEKVTDDDLERAEAVDLVKTWLIEHAGEGGNTKKRVMGIMERELSVKTPVIGEIKDSTPLWNLKRWWKRASKRDRSAFKKWIENN